MEVFNTLVNLHFGDIIAESAAQTRTGEEFLNKYKSFVLNNCDSMAVVNQFVREAHQFAFDKGVEATLAKISEHLTNNKVGWQLASVCEQIQNDNRSYNFINKSVLNQVSTLLEHNEEEICNYIKAGALKNCQYVPAIHAIVKSVVNNRAVQENFDQYTITHPFSLLENSKEGKYFAVGNRVYDISMAGNITESVESNLSNDFRMIMGLLNSNKVQYANESFTYNAPNYNVVISEAGKLTKVVGDKKTQYTTEQFRENTMLYLNGYQTAEKIALARDFETLARISERFDDICNLDNVSIVSSANNTFAIIEANNEGTYAIVESINSRIHSPFKMEGDIMECVNFIKSRCNIDLSEKYSEQIATVCENEENKSRMMMEHEIAATDIEQRRAKVMEMIERFKDKPGKLAVLSQIALQLNQLEA